MDFTDKRLRYMIASIAGPLVHHSIFIHGEWHLRARAVFLTHVLATWAVIAAESLYNTSWVEGSITGTLEMLLYVLSLLASIGIYRLWFHSLHSFPGPRPAAVSKLWHVWQCRHARNHLVLENLYHKYGPFVRTGPRELTIFSSGAFDALDGSKHHTPRSDWYDLLQPRASLVFTRDKSLHDTRRRIWSHSLSPTAMGLYAPKILNKVEGLRSCVHSANGRPVLVNDLMNRFSFDLMGEFAFSHDFGSMERSTAHPAMQNIQSAMTLLGPFTPAIWLAHLGFGLAPGLWKMKEWSDMLKYCDSCMDRRMQTEADDGDVASALIKEYNRDKNVVQENWLKGDAATVIVAGSDTTAASLTALFHLLALNPRDADIIFEEVSRIDLRDFNAVATLHHLNGAINETMRLLPAIPTTFMRDSPPEGITIEGVYIPGNTKIVVSRYSMGRLQTAWKDPHRFFPERWYTSSYLILDRRAFAPFGVGRTSCVGKTLALTAIRLAAAHLLAAYKITLPPGDTGQDAETDMKDQLVADFGDVKLIFTSRDEKPAK